MSGTPDGRPRCVGSGDRSRLTSYVKRTAVVVRGLRFPSQRLQQVERLPPSVLTPRVSQRRGADVRAAPSRSASCFTDLVWFKSVISVGGGSLALFCCSFPSKPLPHSDLTVSKGFPASRSAGTVLCSWAKLQCRVSCCRAGHETSCPLLLDVEVQKGVESRGRKGKEKQTLLPAAVGHKSPQTFIKADR